jgi:hypothetical protein
MPKHGGWLEMAEIELGILNRQCRARRIDNVEVLRRETATCEMDRNGASTKVNW